MKNQFELNPNEYIEVICKSKDKVFKITNITRKEFKEMKRKKGFSYQAFQPGFCCYPNAVEINYEKTNK